MRNPVFLNPSARRAGLLGQARRRHAETTAAFLEGRVIATMRKGQNYQILVTKDKTATAWCAIPSSYSANADCPTFPQSSALRGCGGAGEGPPQLLRGDRYA